MNKHIHFNRCLFVDMAGRRSANLLELARLQATLTFDKRFLDPHFFAKNETPFREIKRIIPSLHKTVLENWPAENVAQTYEGCLRFIINTLKTVLMQLDPNEQYLFSHSGGADSRIFSGIMVQLQQEGKCNFDNVTFHCWGRPEKDSFLKIIARCGWKNISILDDSQPDVYDVGRSVPSTEGWYPYTSQMKFWGKHSPSEYILLSGAEGETLYKPFNQWIYNCGYFCDRGESILRQASLFKDVFFPYLTSEMLQVSMGIPDKWKNIADPRLGRDKIRTDLVEQFNLLNIAMPKSFYNLNISESRKKLMMDLYNKSSFKKKFGISLDIDDLFTRPNGFFSKLWGFAVTTHELID